MFLNNVNMIFRFQGLSRLALLNWIRVKFNGLLQDGLRTFKYIDHHIIIYNS